MHTYRESWDLPFSQVRFILLCILLAANFPVLWYFIVLALQLLYFYILLLLFSYLSGPILLSAPLSVKLQLSVLAWWPAPFEAARSQIGLLLVELKQERSLTPQKAQTQDLHIWLQSDCHGLVFCWFISCPAPQSLCCPVPRRCHQSCLAPSWQPGWLLLLDLRRWHSQLLLPVPRWRPRRLLLPVPHRWPGPHLLPVPSRQPVWHLLLVPSWRPAPIPASGSPSVVWPTPAFGSLSASCSRLLILCFRSSHSLLLLSWIWPQFMSWVPGLQPPVEPELQVCFWAAEVSSHWDAAVPSLSSC